MKQKMNKIFENAVWWSGVVMVGLVLGVSLQFVRAWTEPTAAPPNGNVGAPINTGIIGQAKQGVLQVLGLTVYNDPAASGVDVTGKVLTAQNANGAVAWAAGGSGEISGGCIYTTYSTGSPEIKGKWGEGCKDNGPCAECLASGWDLCGNVNKPGYMCGNVGLTYINNQTSWLQSCICVKN